MDQAGKHSSFGATTPPRGPIYLENIIVSVPPSGFDCRNGKGVVLNQRSLKNWSNIQDGGHHRKINPKSLGPVFSLCCRARNTCRFSESAIFLLQVYPPSSIKSKKQFEALRWRLLRRRLTLSDERCLKKRWREEQQRLFKQIAMLVIRQLKPTLAVASTTKQKSGDSN